MVEGAAAPEAETVRLRKIIDALVNRAERATELQGTDFSLFQTTIMLEEQVKAHTAGLEAALRENERINRALKESEARYRALVDQSLVGIAIIAGGRFSFANRRFEEIFGYEAQDIAALGPLDVAVPEDRAMVAEQMRRRLAGETDRVHYQLRGRRKDGEQIDLEIHGNTVEVSGERVLLSVIQEVSDRVRAERELLALQHELREQSLHDPLTGLYNRRYLDEALGRELLQAARRNAPVSFIMGDLDHFKEVNDRHGHQGGDQVLRVFAALLKASARGSDLDCRLGGEEFLLVLPGMTKDQAAARAERLRADLAGLRIEVGDGDIAVTASFGVATFPDDGEAGAALIAAADEALYAAKASGRNRVVAR